MTASRPTVPLLRAIARCLAAAALVSIVPLLLGAAAPEASEAAADAAAGVAAKAHEPGAFSALVPNIVALAVAAAIEVYFLLRDTIPICCWWFVSSFGLVIIGKMLWSTWRGSVPMDQLILSPAADGIQFRVSVIAFGIICAALAVGFLRAGVLMTIRSAPDFSQSRNRSILVTTIRLLPLPVAAVMACKMVIDIFRVFQH